MKTKLETLTKRPEGELSLEELERVTGGVNVSAQDLLARTTRIASTSTQLIKNPARALHRGVR